jgi:hypothetical protein
MEEKLDYVQKEVDEMRVMIDVFNDLDLIGDTSKERESEAMKRILEYMYAHKEDKYAQKLRNSLHAAFNHRYMLLKPELESKLKEVLADEPEANEIVKYAVDGYKERETTKEMRKLIEESEERFRSRKSKSDKADAYEVEPFEEEESLDDSEEELDLADDSKK